MLFFFKPCKLNFNKPQTLLRTSWNDFFDRIDKKLLNIESLYCEELFFTIFPS